METKQENSELFSLYDEIIRCTVANYIYLIEKENKKEQNISLINVDLNNENHLYFLEVFRTFYFYFGKNGKIYLPKNNLFKILTYNFKHKNKIKIRPTTKNKGIKIDILDLENFMIPIFETFKIADKSFKVIYKEYYA